MRFQGRVTDWKDDKGFGFITPNGGGPTVFLHIKSFSSRGRRPVGNELVTYDLTFDKQNRAQASNVTYVASRKLIDKSPVARPRIGALVGPLAFLSLVVVKVFQGKLHPIILAVDVIASCMTYMLYAFDKAAAMQGDWRTEERTLHIVSLLGGWPGAMIAQSMFRHKTKKASFQVAFWCTIALNCAALAWFLTPSGKFALARFLAGG